MRRIRLSTLWWCLLLAASLAGCGGNPADDIPAQHWKGLTVDVQTRPAPVVIGMNEFILIVSTTGEDKPPPTHNMIVSIRTNDTDSWKQMIQDGYMGVFRRAARVDDPKRQVLNVQIQQGDDLGYLRFPLHGAPPPPKSQS